MRTVLIPEMLARHREQFGLSNGRGQWKRDGGFRAHLTRAQLREIEEYAQANGFGGVTEFTGVCMKRQHSPAHLDFVRSLPCIVCGDNTATEAAHIRYADVRAGKRGTGLGEKPDDDWTLPLCGRCHRDQHKTSERLWWAAKGVDPVKAAMALARVSEDREAAERILTAHRTY